jgi:hypothetical protein
MSLLTISWLQFASLELIVEFNRWKVMLIQSIFVSGPDIFILCRDHQSLSWDFNAVPGWNSRIIFNCAQISRGTCLHWLCCVWQRLVRSQSSSVPGNFAVSGGYNQNYRTACRCGPSLVPIRSINDEAIRRCQSMYIPAQSTYLYSSFCVSRLFNCYDSEWNIPADMIIT